MSTFNRNTESNQLKIYEVTTRFGPWGYVMAKNVHEARRLARPYLPLSDCRAEWFAVNEVHELDLVEI